MNIDDLKPGVVVFSTSSILTTISYRIKVKKIFDGRVIGDWMVTSTGQIFENHECGVHHFLESNFVLAPLKDFKDFL